MAQRIVTKFFPVICDVNVVYLSRYFNLVLFFFNWKIRHFFYRNFFPSIRHFVRNLNFDKNRAISTREYCILTNLLVLFISDKPVMSSMLHRMATFFLRTFGKSTVTRLFFNIFTRKNYFNYSKTPFIATPSNQMPPVYRKKGGVPTSSPPAWTTDYQQMLLNE